MKKLWKLLILRCSEHGCKMPLWHRNMHYDGRGTWWVYDEIHVWGSDANQ